MTSRLTGLLVAAVTACSLQLFGCVHHADLIASGALRLDKIPERRGHFRDIHADVEDNAIRIIGYVRRSTTPGHVHVSIEDVDGKTLVNTRAEVTRVPRSARRVRHARFEALIAESPPIGSTVRIRHHIGDCDEPTPVDGR